MSFRNDLKDHIHRCREETRTEALKTVLLMLAPLAPHVSEELWQLMAPETGSIHQQAWPAFDEQFGICRNGDPRGANQWKGSGPDSMSSRVGTKTN